MAYNKPQIEEFIQQIDGEIQKLSSKLRTIADAKEDSFLQTLKLKLEETKREYANLKLDRNETKLLKDLQKEKVKLMKERALILEDTVEKSFKVQQAKNTLQSYRSLNEDLEAEIAFLVGQLAKPTIKAPELSKYLAKLDEIEKGVFKPKKSNVNINDRSADIDVVALRNNQAKEHTLKAEKNTKLIEELTKKKHKKAKPRNDIYVLDDIFNEVVQKYSIQSTKDVSDLKGKNKEEIFEAFLGHEEAKKYLYEVLADKYSVGSQQESADRDF